MAESGIKTSIVKNIEVLIPDSAKSHKQFLHDLGFLESHNRYDCVNSLGYCGRYQFGKQALTEIGLGNFPKDEFLNSPELQELAMNLLLKKNKFYLQPYLGKYNSKTIKHIYITESGLLAGAHCIGHGAVIKWLESNGNIDSIDGNGVKVSTRISGFSGYKLEF